MKVNLKTQQYALYLTYGYIVAVLISTILRFAGVGLSPALDKLKLTALQVAYVLIFVYITMLLATNRERRAVVIAFAIYTTLAALGSMMIFISDYGLLRIFLITFGSAGTLVVIYLIVLIFWIRHPIISKYCKTLGAIMASLTALKILMPFAAGYMGNYYSNSLYRIGWLYIELYALLIPVVIIVLLKRTRVLLTDYVPPAETYEEYL
ncbi:hypothetical protein [Mucilaginibacter gilvus]|uniref:Uncharacterized protein n=1 Tax=Mucilaginibacter gilvus TaxID=2305909 RepID=A0A3S3V382_9SPHI|nr:hypothetical protein [Mucilaginibacter gilvus]RWY56983.1 hypothetical protein EPL05_00180 [Mucilaginibacter gilvus]